MFFVPGFSGGTCLIPIIFIAFCYVYVILTQKSGLLPIKTHYFILSWPKCPHCNFTPLKYWSNSTPDDYFIMFAYGSPQEIYPCIRSIRTVGSRCAIVVIIDSFNVSPMFSEPFFSDCGVMLTFYHTQLRRFECPLGIMHHCWIAFRDYLRDLSSANRVCISDCDVIMQEDPFSVYINQRTENDLYLMDQDFSFANREIDRRWANAWYMPERGDFPCTSWIHKQTLNCGSIFGSYRVMLVLCAEMAERFLVRINTSLPCTANDQGGFYHIMYNGWPRKNNITRHFFNSAKDPYAFIMREQFPADPYPNCTLKGPHKIFYIHHLQTSNQNHTIRPMCPKISPFDRLRYETV